MKYYLYNYQTSVSFALPVTRHAILLRCQPRVDESQQVVEEHLVMPQKFVLRLAKDVFGNRVLYGGTEIPHQSLQYVSTGIVSLTGKHLPVAPEDVVFRFASPLTHPNAAMAEYASNMDLPQDADGMAYDICMEVNKIMTYRKCVTTTLSTAADALATREGVCQDYAHLMIALCRLRGVAARYVCGFLAGLLGETHAWVEVACADGWHAFDPTNGVRAEWGYIALARGRDAADCSVSRGMVFKGGQQMTYITVTAEEII